MMTSQQMAEKIVEVLSNKIGRDIKLIKIDAITVLADYFVDLYGGLHNPDQNTLRRG